MNWRLSVVWTAAILLAVPTAASAQSCRAGMSFERWLDGFKREAAAQGISQRTLAVASPLMSFDQGVVNRDRGQRVFSQTFVEFANRMVASYRLQQGAQRIKKHAAVFARIEEKYGVPAPVIVAFWGLETDFGANIGNMPTLRSLATLAYDCRRPELFRPQLLAALKIIERGDLAADQMVGPFAGELGQLQFLPSHYYDYGVDFDGDGRRDLLRSAPDALASAANYMAQLGWRRGEPWLQEVSVPARMQWEEADLNIQHPRVQWARWGVALASGAPLPADNVRASLLLPMGRHGPAFLAYQNFRVFLQWNQSLVYSTTAAYFATRLAGAPPMRRGNEAVEPFGFQQIRELQGLLARRGYDVGKLDGFLGEKTRAAVKAMQMKFGLPADSYPTLELLARLRGQS
jgi:lytic murein transglycosylase